MSKNVAIILSGCGHLDGAEIREAVLALLYLDQQGASVQLFAPDVSQQDVIDHRTGQPTNETRNILQEASRIARGDIAPLSDLQADAFDALILPGGFGVAKSFSDIANKGADATPLTAVADIVCSFYQQQKPIGAICIAPAFVALALKGENLLLTIGDDEGVAGVIEALGHRHQPTPSEEAAVDRDHKIVTCSAYMREDSLASIAKGIEQLVRTVLSML